MKPSVSGSVPSCSRAPSHGQVCILLIVYVGVRCVLVEGVMFYTFGQQLDC